MTELVSRASARPAASGIRAAVLLLAGSGVWACGGGEAGRLPRPADPVDLVVAPAVRAPAIESFPAALTSARSAVVATRMSGTVEEVGVDAGASVRAGDVLVRLDATDLSARVRAARAALELAELTFGRMERLAADGAAARVELDAAASAREIARGALADAEAQAAYAVVRAPFAGIVTRRAVDPGDLAAPGRPLLTLVAPGELKVTANLPARWAGRLSAGDEVRVRLDGLEERLAARVVRVVGALEEGSRTFRVEALLAGAAPSALPGAFARIEVERADGGSRWIPADALVERGQLRGVYAVEGGAVRLRWVRLGRPVDDAVELLAGPAGDLVVVRRPSPELYDGRPVGRVEVERPGFPGGDPAGDTRRRLPGGGGPESEAIR